MVCACCINAVKSELKNLDIQFRSIELTEVETINIISPEKLNLLDKNLRQYGLELIEGRNNILIEKIKIAIVEFVHYSDEEFKINLSDYLREKLNYDYTYLANIFSKVQGTSIEKFFISHKIERVKELLVYNELNLTEICYRTRYSSLAHLSYQFKKTTGLAPSKFRHLQHKSLLMLEQVNCQ